MSIWKSRYALGGALTAILFVGTGVAARGQQPHYPALSVPLVPTMPSVPMYPTVPHSPASATAPILPLQHSTPGVDLPTGLPAGSPSALPGLIPSDPPLGSLPAQPGLGSTPQPVPVPSPAVGMDPVPIAPAPADPNKPVFNIDWDNGLWIRTANRNFTMKWGATVQYDFAWYSASPLLSFGTPGGVGAFNDGANLRRARINTEGTLYNAVDYKFELEFMNGIGFSPAGTTAPINQQTITNAPGPTDAWINVKDVPFFGNVRIGSQKEWFSLEHLNSYRYLEFLERSYLFDFSQMNRFNNGFSPGISTFRTWANDRIFTAVGAYKNDSDLIGFNTGDGQYSVTGRIAALPIWMPDQRMFWHIGGAMSHRDPVNGQVQINVRDNVRNAPFPLLNLLVNTGLLNASSQDLFNIETAAVWGPLTFQAEYTANIVNGASVAATATTPTGPLLGNLVFGGYYAEVMWLLTGESRTWNTKNFFFNRVVPKRPLRLKYDDCDGYGFGAWELAARYTHLDVSNKTLQAGVLDSVTLGLNWYLNMNTKLQFNYDYTQRGDTNNPAQGHIHAFGTRMAVDF